MAKRGPGGGSFERPTQKPTVVLRRIWRYLAHYRWLLLGAVALSIGGNLLALVGPKLSGHAIDAMRLGKGGVDFDAVLYYAGWMAAFYAVSSALSYLLAWLMLRLSRGVVYRMRKDVFERLTALPVKFFDTHQTGEVISTLSYDIDTINASLSNDLLPMLSSVITVFGSLWMMLSIEPSLVLVFAVTIPVSLLFTRYRSRRVRPLYRARSEKLGQLNGYVEEMTDGQKTIKAYGRERVYCERFDERNREAVEANYRADHFACITGPSVNFLNNLSLALISVFGALQYMAGGITLGNISSFVLYSRKFSGPINEFANIWSELQSALAAAERVFRLLDEPPEAADAPGAQPLESVRGDVALRHVDFGYDSDRLVLQDFDLHALRGKVVAIVGPTGSGKTTVINLLMRFYDVNRGSVTVDGQNIYGLTRDSLRRSYAMVLQDSWLFHGTIYENLTYGREDATREQVEAAARAAHIHRFIISLPEGYDTVLSDNGVNISKGQRQLLTIVRAMLMDTPMLILDEATSNVDTQTERQIQRAMLKLMEGRTCFVIAHRLSTIRGADLIAVVREGRVAEQGTHEALMARKGYYYALYSAQFDRAAS